MWNRLAGRPSSDAILDTEKYQWLADGQQYVVATIASIMPQVLYGPPIQMTTADSGQTFTFGTDVNSAPITPMGKVGIYSTLRAIPDDPWTENDDYLSEGVRIRLPNNMAYGGTLYWYGITPPIGLSASIEPVLMPPPARELIVIKAVRDFAESAEQNLQLAAAMAARWDATFPMWMLTFRTQFRSGGVLASLTSSAAL